jgi:hypothetical protein
MNQVNDEKSSVNKIVDILNNISTIFSLSGQVIQDTNDVYNELTDEKLIEKPIIKSLPNRSLKTIK